MRRAIIFISCMVFLLGCAREFIAPELIYIRHKGADMPVVVSGNQASGVYIIYLHGGPGGSSFIDIHNGFFASIEEEFNMVYYDQRASGNSKGKSKHELLTLNQFIEDLDVIIGFIRDQYEPEHIFLLGHSWGGTLGTAYLLDEDRRKDISGWIEVDGGHNIGQSAYELSRDFLFRRVDSVLLPAAEDEKEIQDWNNLKSWYEEIDNWRDPKIVIQHSKNLQKVGGYFYSPENREGLVGADQIFFSETNFLGLLHQNKQVLKHMDIWHYDFTDRLDNLNLPILVLWGRYDGILPVQLGLEAKAAMQLQEENFYIFESSGHSPHYEETALFNKKVIQFVKNNI